VQFAARKVKETKQTTSGLKKDILGIIVGLALFLPHIHPLTLYYVFVYSRTKVQVAHHYQKKKLLQMFHLWSQQVRKPLLKVGSL